MRSPKVTDVETCASFYVSTPTMHHAGAFLVYYCSFCEVNVTFFLVCVCVSLLFSFLRITQELQRNITCFFFLSCFFFLFVVSDFLFADVCLLLWMPFCLFVAAPPLERRFV